MILLALALAVAGDGPHKLVLVLNENGAVVVDYPSAARCAAAKAAAEQEAKRRNPPPRPGEDPIIRPALRVIAFCIPG